MRVFVTGASGYIGQVVAKTFRAKGHTVHGLVRSEEQAEELSLNEIWPILGDMQKPQSYEKILDDVEVAVHCAMELSDKTSECDEKTIDTILKGFSKSSSPRAIIYTSGVWVYGANSKLVDESFELNPIDIVKWRPDHEEKILKATSSNLRTVVIRPGNVYGKVGGQTKLFFDQITSGKICIPGEGYNHWPMIHVQDLAHAYVSAAEKELSNVILNISDDSLMTLREVAEAVAKSGGIPGQVQTHSKEEAEKYFGPIVEGMILEQQINNARAKRLLNWKIHHAPFINDADLYFNAWKATQEIEEF